ncbi:MAG: hypothetical protein H7Z37_05665 [Pyrinomonadaceae bacterium]|nr:hypothetical protein [Pyrinomonadaceae bacterium]
MGNGEIGKVTLVSGLPFGLSEAVIEAATKIKFESARENGVLKTTNKTIEYGFSLYNHLDFIVDTRKQPLATIDEKADVIINKAVARLGGEKYLNVKTVIGRGNYSQFADGVVVTPSVFVDYISSPDKERTEFKSLESKIIQTNVGDRGWIFDSAARAVNDQNPMQIENHKQIVRTSLDYFLRGKWRGDKDAKLEYVGKREAGFAKRNDVVSLIYGDGLKIEFEFEMDGTPVKSFYKRRDREDVETSEEDRFAQFVDIEGVFVPLIIDHFRDGKQISRINYISIEINAPISDSIFAKPANIKNLKK